MKNLTYLLSSLFVLTLLLSACGGTPDTTSDAPTATPADSAATDDPETAASDERGTLRVAHEVYWGGVESLDPASPIVFYDAIRPVYDSLVRTDANRELLPSLATAWEANEDASVWTFTLRDDVTFHDGTSFTSADVAYTIERLLSPDSASPASAVLNIIERTETPDEQTVVFHLSQPHAELPKLFTTFHTSIIPADSSETIGETGIGTGPFQLEQLDATSTTRLVANDNYWQGAPGLAALELIGIADVDARFHAFQAGQLDLLFEPSPQQAGGLEDSANVGVQRFPGRGWYSIEMRTDTPPFDDPQVRKALRLVTDRQAMVDLVLQGEGIMTCDNIVGPDDPHRWDGECTQDISQARELLAEAGYPNGIDVTLYTSNSLSPMVPLAEVYQQQAAEAGINVTIEQVPPDTYWTDVWGVEPMFVSGDLQYPADFSLHLFYHSGSPYNASYYANPAFEQLLADARAALDADERTALYQQAQQLLFEDGGTLVPFRQIELRAFRDTVSGVEPISRFELPWHTITIEPAAE
jgi:peptide/nickel transport system substrate-binding protein